MLSKGVILLLIWNAVFWISSPEPYLPLLEYDQLWSTIWPKAQGKVILHNLFLSVYLLYPLIGWTADAKFGRYKLILVSLCTISLVILFETIAHGFTLSHVYSQTVVYVIEHLMIYITILGFGGIHANMMPFLVDQLLGASGEQLSAVIHWYFFSLYFGLLVDVVVSCAVGVKNAAYLAFLVLQCLLLILVLLSSCFLHKWLNTRPQISNPIKLIARVLNYARKNKYPRNRSAFTYLDEEHPSRLDFGKNKFGGPFTEEEVEDVKTVLRLLPLLPLMVTFGVLVEPVSFVHHTIPAALSRFPLCLLELRYTIFYTLIVVSVPIYHFLVYPFLYKYSPSMLKRTGIGLLIGFTSLLAYIVLDVVGHAKSPAVGCMFNNSLNLTSSDHLQISSAWVLVPQFFLGVGDMLALISSLEFVCAQSPAGMRGLMIGLWFALIGLMDLLGLNLHYLFEYTPSFSSAQPSCGLYYYLTKIVLSGSLLSLFVALSRRYKYRERNRVINLQFITEETFEKYLNDEEQYQRERALDFTTTSTERTSL